MMTPQSDPAGLYGSLAAVLGAILALLTAFGVPLTQTQEEAILGLFVVAGPLVTAWLIRRKAWAPDSVESVTREAYQQGREDGSR